MSMITPSSDYASLKSVLSWMHIGDLHMTEAEQPNHRYLKTLVTAANRNLGDEIDFVVLPGDNANNGMATELELVREAVRKFKAPIYIVPGDHDFTPGSLDAFYLVLCIDRLPAAITASGVRCIFLDVVSAGTGGPDFQLSEAHLEWLARELAEADAKYQFSVIFAHTYPSDLKKGGEALNALIAQHRVAAVDMGHTHYNELANDGHTIFATTRSTGQIEEGPVGFSMMAVDGGAVSWRFKTLAQAWPFVLITSPADFRLMTDLQPSQQVMGGPFEVRAKAWSAPGITSVACRINDEPWQPMSPVANCSRLWSRQCLPPGDSFRLAVRAEDGYGRTDQDAILVKAGCNGTRARHADGSDSNSIGAWPEKGILGTQLGPNKNGKQW